MGAGLLPAAAVARRQPCCPSPCWPFPRRLSHRRLGRLQVEPRVFDCEVLVFDWKVPVFDKRVPVFDWRAPVFDWKVAVFHRKVPVLDWRYFQPAAAPADVAAGAGIASASAWSSGTRLVR